VPEAGIAVCEKEFIDNKVIRDKNMYLKNFIIKYIFYSIEEPFQEPPSTMGRSS
jgi:hypothetical protein